MSDPYQAWQSAREAASLQGSESEATLTAQIQNLEVILSDLDEHGEDNIDQFGDGEYSHREFQRFLDQAKKDLKNLRRKTQRVALLDLPPSQSKIQISPPVKVPGAGGNWPALIGSNYISNENGAVGLRNILDKSKFGPFLISGSELATKDVRSVAGSRDGRLVALGLWNQRVFCFDAVTGVLVFENSEQVDWVTGLSFSGDSRFLVSGGRDKLIVHGVGGGDCLAQLGNGELFSSKQSIGVIHSLDVSPDSRLILVQHREKILVFDAKTLAEIGEIETWSNEFQFFHDRLIALSGNAIKIVDVQNQEVAEEAVLKEKFTRWAGGESLAIEESLGLAALIVREKPEASISNLELQIWSLSPLKCLTRVPLPDFAMDETLSKGGVVFSSGEIILVGESECLNFKYF